jgi:hypothetical protein
LSLEGAFQIASNPLTSLSEQGLVSSDYSSHGGSDQGCRRPHEQRRIQKNGICTESA